MNPNDPRLVMVSVIRQSKYRVKWKALLKLQYEILI
jgi:hypothetical protein